MTKLEVRGAKAGRATPYYLTSNGVLVKACQPKHLYRRRQALGIDEDLYREYRERIRVIRFILWDGSLLEIDRERFEQESFLIGDSLAFMPAYFIEIEKLKRVNGGMKPLFEELTYAHKAA